ncbi:MJ0144 family RNA dihydrouridine synthase-like protein [Methanothermococcus okinawensis]|uniref:TIM-barrel protein n=1 Tax=Methanothermococcus okinawensis (strain DSM 14208 / JCM 11175 / IH1) TaxID=647113 RepID=F8AKE2_METOI|nr:MJ0144 family RNA dihydrouridine synthase-like protein [Methanothermococcus okinawensis]AEH06342.1 TIM-barrel protein [Methanothermococcus okinawensis IH1]
MCFNNQNILKLCKNKKVVLAPMAGITDGKFCKNYKDLFAIVTIGAYDLDNITQLASEKIVKRGRKEFLYNLNKFDELIKKEINDARKSNALVSVNVRFKDIDKALNNIKSIGKYADILELNCHCRQPEITQLSIGQELLKKENNIILKKFLEKIKLNINIPVFLKVRANFVPVNELINNLNNVRPYFNGLHIDCFNPGKNYPDLDYLKEIRYNFKDKIIIGNNSINSIEDAEKMLKYCDFVSVARCVLKGNIDWIYKLNIGAQNIGRIY